VPICRAAFRALELVRRDALLPRMEKVSERRRQNSPPNLRRWTREIALAVLLTIAAVTVISVAWWRGDGANQGVLPLARKQ
jgi:hypothetical protein